MYDVSELNKSATGQLKELYERITGNTLHRHSNQWEGACVVCGHTFWVSDTTPDHFYCRTCGRSYRAIDLVTNYYGLTERSQFSEACNKLADLLGIQDAEIYKGRPLSVPDKKPVQMMSTMPKVPSQEWQKAVTDAVRLAQTVLWQSKYRPQLDYLRSRGFTDDTLKKYCIGYYPTSYSLPVEIDGKPVKAQAGYYIPTFMRLSHDGKSNTLTRVKIRLKDDYYKYLCAKYDSDPEHNNRPNKYISIKGSEGVSLFCSQYTRPVTAGSYPNIIFVEGEFDAMTINQCAGDICKAVTFGSHSNIGKGETWVRWYGEPENIVVCFDNETDEKKRTEVRQHEKNLQTEIIKAQSFVPSEFRGNPPIVHHLPEQYHDWNDILKLPNGTNIIRNILTGFFVDGFTAPV